MNYTLLLLVLLFLFPGGDVKSQEAFKGEEKLQHCRIYIPIKYRNTKKDLKAAELLKNQELIYIDIDPKRDMYTVYRVYLIVEEINNKTYIYLRSVDNFYEPEVKAMFVKFNHKWKRFYPSDCYDRVMGN